MHVDRTVMIRPSSSSRESYLLDVIGFVRIAGIYAEIFRIRNDIYFDKYDIGILQRSGLEIFNGKIWS